MTHHLLDANAPTLTPRNLCALGIMTKAPQPGKVKTRLSPPLTPDEAANINACFLRDTGETINKACVFVEARGVGVFTPEGAEGSYQDILPADFFLLPQRGSDFGQRLTFAAEDLFKAGFASVCLINSDSPTITLSNFTEAVKELERSGDRVVLGPSDDGGYYLIGLKQLHSRLFEDIAWSTERVFAQTMQRAEEIGVDIHKLPSGFDVDDSATLQRLCHELLADQAAGSEVAPNTRAFLMEIVKREGRKRLCPQ